MEKTTYQLIKDRLGDINKTEEKFDIGFFSVVFVAASLAAGFVFWDHIVETFEEKPVVKTIQGGGLFKTEEELDAFIQMQAEQIQNIEKSLEGASIPNDTEQSREIRSAMLEATRKRMNDAILFKKSLSSN